MRDTTHVGDVSKAMVMAALLRAGKRLLLPFSDGARYDLVIEEGRRFVRVQCKTGRFRKGTISFNCYSVVRRAGKYVNASYIEDVDAYGVYCAVTGGCYLVPAREVGVKEGSLRVALRGGKRRASRFEI